MTRMAFVWSHTMASQGLEDEYWLTKDDSLMYSLAKMAGEGHVITVAAMTEKREPRSYERDGYRILLFPVDLTSQPYGSQTSRSLLTHLKQNPPDILYLNSLNMVMNRIILNTIRGSKSVLRAHGKLIHDLLVEDVDVLEVSNEVQRREATGTFLIDRESVWINPFGADTTLFAPKPDMAKEFDIVYVGRIVKGKNIELLLRAFQRVDGKLLLIGKGPHDEYYREVANRLRVGNKTTFHGWVDSSELPDLLNGCRVFVIPSLSEGGGRAVAEAMACGLPVIAMKGSRGSEAYVEHGKSGFVVEPSELPGAICQLLSDEDMQRKFGSRGHEVCKTNFSSNAFYLRLKKLAESLESGEYARRPVKRGLAFHFKRLFKSNYLIARLRKMKTGSFVKRYRA
ncbi:MAG: glycosyltransferase family 4 protein [Methanobacteriota archaeon]|nr:MAG: glycosyltransferase family 4 protein [Euryarchaeota archaeon]